ncbi:MAG TPA: hypothetical protein VK923_04455 [Euzebyales bacterium]|nr:hypothetical protein [Euzebyales bacterium]
MRAVADEAPRGWIPDRLGRVLVDNRQVHVIGVRLAGARVRHVVVLAAIGLAAIGLRSGARHRPAVPLVFR